MHGDERRKEILKKINCSEKPISGTKLAEQFGVSRQVIVQDIALLRAAEYEIVSTTRGYLLNDTSSGAVRIFKVQHADSQIEDELNCIVDLGGKVQDVFINHKIYGRINAVMNITSRRNVIEFIDSIEKGISKPLNNLTSGFHYHTVEAESEKTLDLIEETLKLRGYLVSPEIPRS